MPAARSRPAGAPWSGPARLDVAVGAIVATAGFAGFFVALAGRVRELYARRPQPGPEMAAGIES